MGYKVRNHRLAGATVGISTERVKFDENGIGEIQSKELYDEVITLAHFSPVEDVVEDKVEEATEEAKAEEAKEEKPKAKPKAATKATSQK
jgi:ribosomal protein L19E